MIKTLVKLFMVLVCSGAVYGLTATKAWASTVLVNAGGVSWSVGFVLWMGAVAFFSWAIFSHGR